VSTRPRPHGRPVGRVPLALPWMSCRGTLRTRRRSLRLRDRRPCSGCGGRGHPGPAGSAAPRTVVGSTIGREVRGLPTLRAEGHRTQSPKDAATRPRSTRGYDAPHRPARPWPIRGSCRSADPCRGWSGRRNIDGKGWPTRRIR